MTVKQELHEAQVEILLTLLFTQNAKFSELNKTNLSSDHFNFHIKKLLDDKLIAKNDSGTYELTTKGKEFANRFDTENKALERQAKIGIVAIGVKTDGSNTYYLVQQRLKQPYYGFYGFVTGKVRWGETVEETAKREFLEETGLAGSLKLVGIEHKLDYSKSNDLLEDKFFYIYRISAISGKLIKDFEGGKNEWFTEQEIKQLPDVFGDVKLLLKAAKKQSLIFWEQKFSVLRY